MPDYTHGKIYKLINSINSEIYIGSTTYPYLSERLHAHRGQSKDNTGRRDSKLYIFMREIGQNNFKIELIEKYSCNNRKELNEREQYYIELLKPELNMFRAIEDPNYEKTRRDPEERRQRNKEYYEKNKEQISEKYKIKFTCECGVECRKSDQKRHERSKFHLNYIQNKD